MDNWKELLPEELQSKEMVKNADSLESIINNAVGLESKIGRSLTVPGIDATPEEHDLFIQKVLKTTDKLSTIDNKDDILTKWGKPENKEGYKTDPDKEYGFDVDGLRDEALSLGLTQDQFFNLVNSRQEQLSTSIERNKNELESDRGKVFEEWGAAKADKLDGIEAFMDLMGFPDGTKTAVRENMTSDQLRAFAKAAESIKGETLQSVKDTNSGAATYTKAEAEDAIGEVMSSDAFNDPLHASHKNAKNRYFQLCDMAAGRKPKEYYL